MTSSLRDAVTRHAATEAAKIASMDRILAAIRAWNADGATVCKMSGGGREPLHTFLMGNKWRYVNDYRTVSVEGLGDGYYKCNVETRVAREYGGRDWRIDESTDCHSVKAVIDWLADRLAPYVTFP